MIKIGRKLVEFVNSDRVGPIAFGLAMLGLTVMSSLVNQRQQQLTDLEEAITRKDDYLQRLKAQISDAREQRADAERARDKEVAARTLSPS